MPMMPNAKRGEGKAARNRPQRRGALRASLDVGDAMRVQGRRGADDDEQGDDVRISHPDVGVEAHPTDLRRRFLRCRNQGVRRGIQPLFLRFLRGSPRVTIRRARLAEHRDYGDDVVLRQREIRRKGAVEDHHPWHMDDERDGYVGTAT